MVLKAFWSHRHCSNSTSLQASIVWIFNSLFLTSIKIPYKFHIFYIQSTQLMQILFIKYLWWYFTIMLNSCMDETKKGKYERTANINFWFEKNFQISIWLESDFQLNYIWCRPKKSKILCSDMEDEVTLVSLFLRYVISCRYFHFFPFANPQFPIPPKKNFFHISIQFTQKKS